LPYFFVRPQILILKIRPCIPPVKILAFLEIEQKMKPSQRFSLKGI
jgi:hypothetical protein